MFLDPASDTRQRYPSFLHPANHTDMMGDWIQPSNVICFARHEIRSEPAFHADIHSHTHQDKNRAHREVGFLTAFKHYRWLPASPSSSSALMDSYRRQERCGTLISFFRPSYSASTNASPPAPRTPEPMTTTRRKPQTTPPIRFGRAAPSNTSRRTTPAAQILDAGSAQRSERGA